MGNSFYNHNNNSETSTRTYVMTAYGTELMPTARPVAKNLAERDFFSQFRLPIAEDGVTFWLTKTGQNHPPFYYNTQVSK